MIFQLNTSKSDYAYIYHVTDDIECMAYLVLLDLDIIHGTALIILDCWKGAAYTKSIKVPFLRDHLQPKRKIKLQLKTYNLYPVSEHANSNALNDSTLVY